MANQRYNHNSYIALPVPAGTVSDDPVRVGAYAGVAQINRDEFGEATVWLVGSYDFQVTGSVDVGAYIYLTDDKELTTDSEGTQVWGIANTAKSSETPGVVEVAPLGKISPAELTPSP